MNKPSGILLIHKEKGASSFSYIPKLRKKTGVQKIGHAGTLDPLAEGLMIFLIGKTFTKQADKFLHLSKEYSATISLGKSTDTYDQEGEVTEESSFIPSDQEIEEVLKKFQGSIQQKPPMFSAKKRNGKKLYELARKKIFLELEPCTVFVAITLESYEYPYLKIHVSCSKGTYIRSLAHDIGEMLGCKGHLSELTRTKIGSFSLESAFNQADVLNKSIEDFQECLLDERSFL